MYITNSDCITMILFKFKPVFCPIFLHMPEKWLSNIRKRSHSFFQSDIKLTGSSKNENEILNTDAVCNSNIIKLDFNESTIGKIMLQVKSKKMRAKSNLIFFEGKRVLKEAVDAGVKPLIVFFSRRKDIEEFKFPENTKLFKMPYNEMKVWSTLTTAPGIVAVCRKPDVIQPLEPDVPVTIICDNIREPGNLGALIRNAVGAGVKDIILSKGCVDLWDTKVIRGSAGTLFRIPIQNDRNWLEITNFLSNDTLLLIATNNYCIETGAESNNCSIPYSEVNYCDYSNITIIIGGETEGISEQAHSLMQNYESKMVTIPLSNGVESLNSVSALSIILFEIKRQIMHIK